ncbi:MAG: hypothetical protein U9P42_00730 [Candidatus Fermentibacteria bacterium]|nr:hypothetical protein [Candidatus Fermentibacteria bacterium]
MSTGERSADEIKRKKADVMWFNWPVLSAMQLLFSRDCIRYDTVYGNNR